MRAVLAAAAGSGAAPPADGLVEQVTAQLDAARARARRRARARDDDDAAAVPPGRGRRRDGSTRPRARAAGARPRATPGSSRATAPRAPCRSAHSTGPPRSPTTAWASSRSRTAPRRSSRRRTTRRSGPSLRRAARAAGSARPRAPRRPATQPSPAAGAPPRPVVVPSDPSGRSRHHAAVCRFIARAQTKKPSALMGEAPRVLHRFHLVAFSEGPVPCRSSLESRSGCSSRHTAWRRRDARPDRLSRDSCVRLSAVILLAGRRPAARAGQHRSSRCANGSRGHRARAAAEMPSERRRRPPAATPRRRPRRGAPCVRSARRARPAQAATAGHHQTLAAGC